jgi:hypothetical protein
MLRKTMFLALLGVGAALVPRNAKADAATDPSGSVVGVWLCSVIRNGTLARPLIYTFHGDGTFNYSSGTTINNTTNPRSPTYNSGLFSRGGGRGEWTHGDGHTFNATFVEILSDARGNLGGVFNIEASFSLTANGQLCSGTSECPDQKSYVSLVRYEFGSPSPDGPIIGQTTLLPTGTQANSICNRVSSGLGFPAPIPPLVPAK